MTNDERMQAAIKELQEAAIVTAQIQARHSEYWKDHIEWLHGHDLALARHDREIAEARKAEVERGKELDARIAALVSAMGEFISRQK